MRICITGFYGFGNIGDEGVLLAIMESLGNEHSYIIGTDLPYTMLADYRMKLPNCVDEVRHIYDVRDDYEVFLLGGGALSWGYGWRQAINAFSHEKLSMNYGVGYNFHQLYLPSLNKLYKSFLERFDAITVRDQCSKTIAENIGVETILTSCPSINLSVEKFDCPKGMIAVCPRYEDYESNEPQINWLVDRLKDVEDEVLLIPFAPFNTEGVPVDLAVCRKIKEKLKRSQILNLADGFCPRRVKYVISQSRLVISGGRYHAIAWAIAHGIPYEISPTSWHYPKVDALQKMDTEFGGEKLKEMEKTNKRIFMTVMEGCKHV